MDFSLVAAQQPLTQAYSLATILAGTSVVASGAATVFAGPLQDVVVDVTYGTVLGGGSVQTTIMGVDPISGFQTSTVVGGTWYAGTQRAGQRLVAVGPNGIQVAVVWTLAGGSLQAMYLSAQLSAGR